MTNMPILDKGLAVQNTLSVKGTKPVSAPEGAGFNKVLKETTDAKQETAGPENKTDTTKAADTVEETKSESFRDELNGSGKAEEKTDETDLSAEETADMEDIAEDVEILEKAGGEMAAALAAQLNIPEETIRETMKDMGMSEISLLRPENVKELMIRLTDGADDMSLITDENFYNAVREALDTLDNVLEETGQETGMNREELKTVIEKVGQQMAAETPETTEQEDTGILTNRAQQAVTAEEKQEAEPVKLPAQEVKLTDEARTQTAVPKVETRQESGGKESETPFMQSGYQHQSIEQQVQTRVVEAESRFPAADTQEIMDQILDYMKVSVKPEVSDLEMQLHPESLGNLHIHISSKEGVVTAQFTAQNESVRAVLESQMMELKQNLEEQGVKVEAVEVTIAEYSLDREPDDNGAGDGRERQKKKGSRNLNLGELDLEDEDLTEEEKLTAEVMQSEGSTVNYTA